MPPEPGGLTVRVPARVVPVPPATARPATARNAAAKGSSPVARFESVATPAAQLKGAIRAGQARAGQTFQQGGTNITVKADSARVDVQRAYNGLYFAGQQEDRDDAVAGALKRRFRAASYRLGGQDWEFLFHTYDVNGDGGLSFGEFHHATRRDAQITPGMLSDKQLEDVFNRIDIDGDCRVSCDEFRQWIGKLASEKGFARDGMIGGDGEDDEDDEDEIERKRKAKNRVPFVAEYIALQRATIRCGQDLSSQKTGMLGAGEVVAVLQVRGRRMKVQRLKYLVKPASGWVSDRTADLKPIMELLPREQWSSITSHTTTVAERVASLTALPEKPQSRPGTWYTSIFAPPGGASPDRPVSGVRNPLDGSQFPVPPPSADAFVDEALREKEARVDHLARAMEQAIQERENARLRALANAEHAHKVFEEVRQAASDVESKRLRKQAEDRVAHEELLRCKDAEEARELLDMLENNHRVRWDALLLGKEVEKERIRLARAASSQERKKQMLVFTAGVKAARGETTQQEMSREDRAGRASSVLFDTLAGRPKETPGAPAPDAAKAPNAAIGSSIDRILKQFSPRSSGSLTARRRQDGILAAAVSAAGTGELARVVAPIMVRGAVPAN